MERFEAGGRVFSGSYIPPLIADGLVYFASSDDNFYGVDIGTGQERWRFEIGGVMHTTPAIGDGMIFFGSHDGNLYAIDLQTGQEQWRFNAGKLPKWADFEGVATPPPWPTGWCISVAPTVISLE